MDIKDRKKIDALEQQIIAEKPWQLRGEISARSRPINSLLYEDVVFENNIKAPKITPETTETLEELIKQRIKDNKFDDPIKKVKPVIAAATLARQVEINSEKSKIGLAQLYEQELITKATSTKVKDGPERDVERRLYALLKKLDALNDR